MNFSTQSGLPARALLAVALFWWGLLGPGPATAQPAPRDARDESAEYPAVYRVEAIVFRHADGRSDRRRSAAPADFTDRLDPLLVAAAFEAAGRQLARLAAFLPVAEVPGTPDEATPFLESGEQTLRPIPPVYSALGDLSTSMQRAMSRLIDAPAFEPVTARGWIQLAPQEERTAAARVHDRSVVEALEPEAGPGPVPVAHVLPFGPLIQAPPPARAIYRLDGTLRLRQRRFLHLDLDLVWQTRARMQADTGDDPDAAEGASAPGKDDSETDETEEAGETDEDGEGGEDGEDDGEKWELHRLQQSRVVRPGRLEYFDSSLFGVLVRIDRFAQVVPEVEDAPTEPVMGAPGDSAPSGRPVTENGG